MSNSPPPGEEAIKPAPSGYTMDFDKLDDPNFNPFESKGPKITSSPPPQKEESQKKEESEPVPSANDEEQLNVTFDAPKRAPPKLGQNRKKVSPKVIKPKAIKPKVQTVVKAEEEEVPLPAKSYSMDFDKFDDPNFNPFESKKAMRNSPELDKTIEREPELEKLDDMEDPNFNPFESKSTIRNTPSPILAKPKSAGYSMDLDDPNFNPFETKKSVSNVEMSPEEVSPQNLTKTISKNDLDTTNGSDDFHSADEGNDENEDPNRTFDLVKNTAEKSEAISKSFVKEKSFASVQSNGSQENYIRGLEKLLFDIEASWKKKFAAAQTLIVRQSIENEQLREDLTAVEQASADALQRHMRVKEKCLLQAQNEQKLRKSNADYEARHHEDTERFDALVERSNTLVAKANEEIEKLEQETTLRIRCLEVENKKNKLELSSTVDKFARIEQEKAELIKLCDDLINAPGRNPV